MIGIYVYTRGVCGVCFAFRSVQLELLNGLLLYFFFYRTLAQLQQSNEAFVSVRATCSKLYIYIKEQ